ncbi:hypothetical protein [Shewanella oncorhynchi]|nr:hypothetical protein [Shewanella oncorhynchi]
MPPAITGATMPILTNPSAVRLAKKLLPQFSGISQVLIRSQL